MNKRNIIVGLIIVIFMSACENSQKENNNLYNADLIVTNGLVVTIDKTGNIYENGTIVIKGDEIIDIGNTEDVFAKYSAKEVINAEGKIVMPGFVNAHTHMGMTIFRGLADDLYLHDWLTNYIFPAEAQFVDAQFVRMGSELAMIEMINSGTTCFNNMYFYQDEVAQAAQIIGMRGIVAESLIDFPVPNSPTLRC